MKRRARGRFMLDAMPAATPSGALSVALFGAALAVAGCGGELNKLHMYDQPRYEPLEESEFFPDGLSARPTVPGTIARGELHEDEAFYTGKSDGRLIDELPIAV